jgi:hypothetical protein
LPAHLTVSRRPGPERLLGIVVLVVIVLAALYAGWIGISNFSRIHV